ncbi:MAG: hypothetical protein ACREDM_15045 [Methylocella sp.]
MSKNTHFEPGGISQFAPEKPPRFNRPTFEQEICIPLWHSKGRVMAQPREAERFRLCKTRKSYFGRRVARLPHVEIQRNHLWERMPSAKRGAAGTIILATIALVVPCHSLGADYSPQEIYALDGKVLCFARHEGFFMTRTGPCDAFTPPRRIAVGATFTANGKERTIGVISAIQADDDWTYGNIDMKKGEWSCAAGEAEADLADNHRSALWLSISKCLPMN